MVADREKDVQLLTHKLQGIMDRGGDIIHIMEIQRESSFLIELMDRGTTTRSDCRFAKTSRPNRRYANRRD